MMMSRHAAKMLAVLALVVQLRPEPALADGEQGVVDKAEASVLELLEDPDFANLHELLARARGVVMVRAIPRSWIWPRPASGCRSARPESNSCW